MIRATALALSVALVGALGVVAAQGPSTGPVAGANVNVIAGNDREGDWTLQRQNEPSVSCSSRNPRHCLAGANDYRTVDIPFPDDAARVTGDAWLGWYTTSDGGASWRTRLLPGFPQDTSAEGIASPLRGYAAGADPVVRAGTNGLLYYSGIVFNREEGGASAVFVSRFIDNNNQEGNGGEPIAYLGTTLIDQAGVTQLARRTNRRGSSATTRSGSKRRDVGSVVAGAAQTTTGPILIDKPWLAVDVPRAGAQTCSLGANGSSVPLQTFPGGRVYVVYTIFDGIEGTQTHRGRILFARSLDCGQTWSVPRAISKVPTADVNGDGVANTADVSLVYASLNRTCGQTGYNPDADVNNDCKVTSADLAFMGQRLGKPVPVQPRLSQGATLAIDPQTGAVQLAWRQFRDGVSPDAIVAVRSNDGGTSFSAPVVVAQVNPFDQVSALTKFRTNGFPTIAMDGIGRAYLAWSTRGLAPTQADPLSGDARIVISTSTNGATWSTPTVVDNQPPVGHQIMPALTFAQGKLQLVYYDLREDLSQVFGPFVDEQPILDNLAELRHTIEVRGAQADPGDIPAFTSFRLTQYRHGDLPGTEGPQQLEFNPPNLPLFRAGTTPFMGDYIDTQPEVPFVRDSTGWRFNTAASATSVFHAIWTDNRDVRPPANGDWTAYTPPNPPFTRPTMSAYDPTIQIPTCVPGQAGMRNQNVYTSRISQGLIVGALSNAKPLGTIQRSFPVFAQNTSGSTRAYRLTILDQPQGGEASFKQFELLTSLDVAVPAKSTVARTVFARSSDAHAQIRVSVVEITAPFGTPVPNGQQGTVVLNPDPTNPDIENPDIENPDIENPDIENPDIENPDIENQEVYNPDIENANVRNPDIENPDIENPDIENPDIENATVANPSILNPDIENPDIENPDIENPDIENPDIENADLVNGGLSDTTWTITNKGNTAGAFTVNLALNQAMPAGFKSQLIAHKLYKTPTVLGCSLLSQPQTVLLANIPNPQFVAPNQLANPDIENPDIENLTIALGPGETARITLRVFDPNRFDTVTYNAAQNVAPAIVSQAVNTADVQNGSTQPPVAGVLTSNEPVAGAAAGGTYSTTLDGIGTGTWTIVGGELPPGTTLDGGTGVISGTPTTPGTYRVTLKYVSTTGLIDFRTISINVAGAGGTADVGLTVGASPPVPTIGSPLTYTVTARNQGPAVASNVIVTDTLPAGTTFVSALSTQGTCSHANGTVICQLGTLAASTQATITLVVTPNVGGTHVNQVKITAAEADPVITSNVVQTTSIAGTVTPCAGTSFSGPVTYPVSASNIEARVEKGDFNNDGKLDLLYPAADTSLILYFGDGAGGFGSPTPITVPGSASDYAVADFNHDGDVDIAVHAADGSAIWTLLGNGSAGFGSPIVTTTSGPIQLMGVADFNKDGNPDLARAHNVDGSPLVTVLFGNGDGTFQAALPLGGVPASGAGAAIAVDDFNGDGNLDIAAANDNGNTALIFLGTGTGLFGSPSTFAIGDDAFIWRVGDLNGDSRADLLIHDTTTSRRVQLYLALPSGGFAAPVDITPAADVLFTTSADLDGDGDLDLITTNQQRSFAVQHNNGAGGFGAPITFLSPRAFHLQVGDFNGDLRPDLALGGTEPASLLVYLNTCAQPPADLAVNITAPAGPVAEGATVSSAMSVTNNGPNTATGVVLMAVVSDQGEITSLTPTQGTCSQSGNAVTCSLGALAPGATVTVNANVRAQAGGTLQTTTSVTALTGDPSPTNNVAVATTTVTAGASTFVVTTTADGGPGSLRQAIAYANADGGPADTIAFNITEGTAPFTIRPTGNPYEISETVTIDATTQPGYAGTPLIELSGENGVGAGFWFGGPGATNIVIRGFAINRFDFAGIAIWGNGGASIEANYIGTDPSGTLARPNGTGIIVGSFNNNIGGATVAARNVISGNNGPGILLRHIFEGGVATSGNVVRGNYIGVGSGAQPLPNAGDGIRFFGSNINTVGGVAAGESNVIAFNDGNGINLELGLRNRLTTNEIFSNGLLGIDLGNDGLTANDAGDADTGPNTRQNFPVLTSATSDGTTITVQGTLNSTPNTTFRVELFAGDGDPSGFGEGADPVGALNVTTDGTGNASFSTTLPSGATTITATATSPNGNTSEFSASVPVIGSDLQSDLFVDMSDSPDPVTVGSSVTYVLTVGNNGPDAAAGVSVVNTLPGGVTFVSATPSQGTCSGTATVTCALGSIANGATATVTIVVTPTAAGAINNSAFVTSATTDGVAENNAAGATTTVDAAAPQTFVVTNTNNSGAGSLRQAILNANASAGTADTITFSIPGTGPHTIAPTSALPTITDPVTIDGSTQSGFAGTPLIEISGANAGANVHGLVISTGSSVVRGLTINRFTANGILLQGSGNRIEGNFIGTDVSGTTARPNTSHGVLIFSANNRIGGDTAGARNLISGNQGSGIAIQNAAATGNIVQGNFVGTNLTGSGAIPNTGLQSGIFIFNASNNVIGGSTAGAGNVVSGNAFHAITAVGATASANIIQANFVGTDPSGDASNGNSGIGIDIVSAVNTVIGGVGSGRNIISGNGLGIQIRTQATGTLVQNNYIGVNATNTAAIPNGSGINLNDSANGNTIGGVAAGVGNVIAANNGFGVVVTTNSVNNAILGNSIRDNGGLGIDLDNDGMTANDAGDVDTGGNARQNFPVLTQASGGVQGTLNALPSTTYTIQLFTNATCDPSGFGEGATLHASFQVTTDASGNASIPFTAAPAGTFVTATATDAAGNTSEFSACVLVTSSDLPVVTIAATDPTAVETPNDNGTFTITRTGSLASTLVVDLEPATGTATFNVDYQLVGNDGQRVAIPAGQASAVVTVLPLADENVEPGETVVLTLATGAGYTLGAPATATVSILDEPPATIAATDPSAAEGGADPATFTISRTGAATFDRDVSVTVSGTATYGVDYLITSAAITTINGVTGNFTVRIPSGQTSVTVTVTPLIDAAVEGAETVVFTAEGTAATATIADEPLATIAATDSAAAEGGADPAMFTIARTGAGSFDRDVSVTVSGTATYGVDYLITGSAITTINGVTGNFTVRIPSGQTSVTVTVTPIPDGITEPAETVILTAEGTQATATISDEAATTADLALTNVDAPDPAVINGGIVYTLTVTNNGSETATDVSLVDTLSDAVTFVSATPSQGSCSRDGNTVTCPLGAIAGGGQATVQILATPTSLGTVSNSATVTATSVDPSPANNTATISTTVVNAPQTFVVTNTADSGPGSLRQAILNLNANTGAGGFISFNIGGTAPHTIRPLSPLPTLTETAFIDGWTQPGSSGQPLIELDGVDAGVDANGLMLTGDSSSVRGLVINRFGGSGVVLQAGTGSIVAGNYIGTTVSGTAAAGNRYGVTVLSSGHGIGNLDPAHRNVISGNHIAGVNVPLNSARGNFVVGNYIGTDVSGTLDVGNQIGVLLHGESNIVGYTSAEGRNVISGNDSAGVVLGGGASANSLFGNFIGTTAAGTGPLPNGVGVRLGTGLSDSASSNTIGGNTAPLANRIASNTGAGIAVSIGSTNNTIVGNSIDGNGGLGIDLNDDGVTANDIGDADTGANDSTNFPVLTAVSGGVQGVLDSTPDSGFVVQLFTVPACDPSGHGEGATLLASNVIVATDATGHGVIPFTVVPPGAFVTATATDGSGNTSEFSACVHVADAITLTPPNASPIGIGRDVVFTVTLPQPAPQNGVTVTVTSDNPSIASILAPGTTFIASGQAVGSVTVRGIETGDVILRANAPGYLEGTRSVRVTPNLINTPETLTVPFGQTTELPISIATDPAPAGGLTVQVVSANPSAIEVVTPQVVIPPGAFSVNATVRGLQVGSASVTASHPDYSPSTTAVSSSAELNILQSTASFNNGLPGSTLTVRLESAGTPIAAQPAVTVGLTSGNPSCVTAPASVTIATGLASTTFQVSYGGSAALPCTTTVTATASNLSSDSVTIMVNPPAAITPPSAATVGAGLMRPAFASLGASEHGGVTMTVQSNDPTRVLVAPDIATAGTASFSRQVPNGQTSFTYYVQGFENITGDATVTLSAPGFTGDSHTVTVAPSGVDIQGLDLATTTLTPDDIDWGVNAGLPCGGNAFICEYQVVRTGGPGFVVTLTSSNGVVGRLRSDQPVASGVSVTKPIQAGFHHTQAAVSGTFYGVAFEPLANGTTTITATGPVGVLTMTTTGVRQVTVSAPSFIAPSDAIVGAGLMRPAFGSIDAAEHTGVTMTVQSNDPTRVLVAPDTATAGAASFSRQIPIGQTTFTYYVQGLENIIGDATVTLSAEGFTSDSHIVTVAPSGVDIQGLDAATTTLSPDDIDWGVNAGLPCFGNAFICEYQLVRTGGPGFVVTLTSSNGVVGGLRSDQPAASGASVTKPIQAGFHHTQAAVVNDTFYGLAFEPLATGTTTVSVTGPIGVLTMTTTGVRQVTVSGPSFIAPSDATVGAGLMRAAFGSIDAAEHTGVTMTVQSNNPTRVLVAPDAATAGAASFSRQIPIGQTSFTYYVQGLENITGEATVTLSAANFTSGSHTVTVAPSGVDIQGLDAATTSLSPDDIDWGVNAGLPCAGNAFICEYQLVRTGGPGFVVTLTSSNGQVGRLRSDQPVASGASVTKPIQAGFSHTQAIVVNDTFYGLAFEPLANGTTTVTATGPVGVLTMTTTGVRPVAVSTPEIQVNQTVSVGAGLQVFQSAFLEASQHGGLDVTITSSAPSIVRVSPDASTAGSTSIQVPVAINATFVPFVIAGVEGASGSAVVTLSAPGFTTATILVTVEAPAIEIQGLSGPLSSSDPNQTGWYVQVGLPNATGTFLREFQNVRAGSTGLVITLTNSNATVARLGSDEPPAVGQSVTKPIDAGIYYTTAAVVGPTSYGLTFEILGAGTTTVTATGPAGILQTTGASRTIVVNP